jgi:CheY-like chemotaxis protein
MGSIELAAMNLPDDSTVQQYINNAVRAGQNAADLTRSLLSFTRQMPVKPVTCDIGLEIDRHARLIRGLLDENVSVSVDAGEGDLWATVDRGQLETALINLAINAREAMPSGGAFTLSVSQSDGPKDRTNDIDAGQRFVCIEVRDTGRGIPNEYIDQVFEPFFTTKDVGQGSGLGLSMVVGFAEQAGGLAGIESELGVGTSAYIYLPLVDQPAVSDDAMPPLTLSAGNGETVLIVEDNPEVLTFMSNSLRQRNYHVIKATDMNSAMDKLADQPEIDVLLTDVALPENKRGADVAAWILRQRPRTKVIYTSGYTRAIVEDDGRLPKGANFLQKPFTVSELERAIRRALDS